MLVNGQSTIKQWKLTHPAARKGTKHYYKNTIPLCLEYTKAALVSVSGFSCKLCTVHILLYTHVCTYVLTWMWRGRCYTPLIPSTPHSPPTSTPNHGCVTLARSCPRAAWRVPLPQAPAATPPHDECPCRGPLSTGIKPWVSGESWGPW